ncbi:MAG: riboflavin biosynthesis protein RibF [Synergistaceae bacterium]|nr:riboflavin biosynthesis protein RibF [Synergistaceae bacterium]
MLITIGAFDGFHKGHRELLRICRENAGDDWAVVTFEPHPSAFMGRIKPLFTLRERELIRRVLGVPKMYVLRFDEALMNLSPAKFWRLLRERLNVDGLVVGNDFRFGYGREGNAEALRELAQSDGLTRIIIADVLNKPRYSSSTVRENITAGNVSEAARILGYPFFMMSRVVHGDGRGRTLGFPTANLELQAGRVIPACGVYSSAVFVKGAWHCGALSLGSNPTFHDVDGTRAEVHLPGFSGDIYGEEVITLLLGRVRDIMTFPDKDALISQIGHDTETCMRIYGEVMSREDTQHFTECAGKYISHGIITPEIINLT